MNSLVEAALRDQTRRVLEASPKSFANNGRDRYAETESAQRCEVCGGKLMRHNRSGVCSRTRACKTTRQRRWNQQSRGKKKAAREKQEP